MSTCSCEKQDPWANCCMRKRAEAEVDRLKGDNGRLRTVLRWISNGCPVPPDGGNPGNPDDMAQAARDALEGRS